MYGFGWLLPKIESTVATQAGIRGQNWEDWYCPDAWESVAINWEDAKMTSCDVWNNNFDNWESISTAWENT